MLADTYINKTEGGPVEISVVRDGLTSGVARKFETVDKARSVLVEFGLDQILIDQHLRSLSTAAPSSLLRFPLTDIPDDVLRSWGFTGAAFQAA